MSIINPYDVIPGVIENSPRGERHWDIYSLLLKERIVMLFTPINDQIANTIIAQLLYLDREDPIKTSTCISKVRAEALLPDWLSTIPCS